MALDVTITHRETSTRPKKLLTTEGLVVKTAASNKQLLRLSLEYFKSWIVGLSVKKGIFVGAEMLREGIPRERAQMAYINPLAL